MIFWRFLSQKYLTYLFTVSVLLGSLYTLIEVLEKLARYRNISVYGIVNFALAVFIPSFIELFPISALVSVVLFFRELHIHGLLLSIGVYGIAPRKIIIIIGITSFLTMCSIFLLHEVIGYKMARHVVKAKIWLLNRKELKSNWLRLGPTSFVLGGGCPRQYILHAGFSPGFEFVDGFSQDQLGGVAKQVTKIDFKKESLYKLKSVWISTKDLDVITYSRAEESFMQSVKLLPSLYGKIMVADFSYFFLKILIFPIFAACAFFLFQQREILRWVSMFAVYLVLAAGYFTLQLLGPLLGIIMFGVSIFFLAAYFYIYIL